MTTEKDAPTAGAPAALPLGAIQQPKPLAYAIYAISNGKHTLRDVKRIPQDDTNEDWKSDDDGLGEFWSGNEGLFALPAQAPSVQAPAVQAQTDAMREALEKLEQGALNVAENAKARGDAYDEGYARAMAKCAHDALAGAAQVSAIPAAQDDEQAKDSALIEQISDVFGIGSEARKNRNTVLANVQNCWAWYQSDHLILDWLEEKCVNVRENLRHGSRDLFWASPTDDDGETGPSDLRAQVTAIIEAERKARIAASTTPSEG